MKERINVSLPRQQIVFTLRQLIHHSRTAHRKIRCRAK